VKKTMTDDEYDVIFANTIEAIRRLEGPLPHSVRAALISALESSRSDIIGECERLINGIRGRFLEDADGQIDRHKSAACFMIALMTKYDITSIEENPQTPKLTKERIAIDVGQSIVVTMMKGTLEENSEMMAFLSKNKDDLVHPDTLCDEGEYRQNWALCLNYSNMDKCLHALPLSNTLFLIEAFNRERARRTPDSAPDFRPLH